MKNSTIPFLLMLIISLFTVACNKEKGDVTPNVLRKVDKVTISDGTFRNYTYDAQGRCVRIDYKDRYRTYVYNGTTVVESTIWTDPTKTTPTYTYTLNAQGLAATRKRTSGTAEYLSEYKYNERGQRIEETNKYRASSTEPFSVQDVYITTYDADGDELTFERRFVANPSSGFIYTSEFDKSHYNTISTEFAGGDFLGKSSIHALSKSTYTPVSGIKETSTYAVLYDAKGYMSAQTITTVGPSGTKILTYTYTYK